MVPWYLWASWGPKGLLARRPALIWYAHLPGRKGPHSASSFTVSTQPRAQPKGFYFPDSRQNYSNKPITSSHASWGQGAPHSLTATKPTSHRLLCFTLFSREPPWGPTWPVMSSFPGTDYMWLLNLCQSHLSDVGCHVFGYLIGLRVGIPPLPRDWTGDDQKN